MQLDNTRIAVRERGLIDTYDLTLHVIRAFAAGLLPALLVGIVPFALLNELLCSGVWEPPQTTDFDDPGEIALTMLMVPLMQNLVMTRFGWLYLLLVFFEAPVATIFAESYLGGAVFNHEKSLRQSVVDVLAWRYQPNRSAPKQMGPLLPFLLCQLILRGTLVMLGIVYLAYGEEFSGGLEIALPIFLFLFVAALRAARPYINEIIVLEKNPLRSKAGVMTVGRRSGNLHNNSFGELVAQWLGSCITAFLLLQALFWSIWFLYYIMSGDGNLMGWVPQHVLRPIALWLVVAFLGVARFLSYLDLRIRQEGWEVELLLRAEAARFAEKLI